MGTCQSPTQKSRLEHSTLVSQMRRRPCTFIVDPQSGVFPGQDLNFVQKQCMNVLHHSHMGPVVCIDDKNQMAMGSGILISSNLVLTCAHVIYHEKEQRYFPKIFFFPGQHGPFQIQYQVQTFRVPPQYAHTPEDHLKRKYYDFALLKLTRQTPHKNFIQLSTEVSEEEKINAKVLIYGYPSSKYKKNNNVPQAVEQFGLTKEGHLLDLDADFIMHRISTEPGVSGAPLVKVAKNNIMSIVGVHLGCSTNRGLLEKHQTQHPTLNLRKVNVARRVNDEMVRKLTAYAREMGGRMFGVRSDQTMEGVRYVDSQEYLSHGHGHFRFDALAPQPPQYQTHNNQEGYCKLSRYMNDSSVQIVNLDDCNLKDDACLTISRAYWPNLKQLYLGGNKITVRGCQYLIQANFPRLITLDLRDNNISFKNQQRLQGQLEEKYDKIVLL